MTQSVAFSHAGDFVAATASPGEIFVWELQTGRLRNIIRAGTHGHELDRYFLALSPDDRYLLTGAAYQQGGMYFYDARTGENFRTIHYSNKYQDELPFFGGAFMQHGERVFMAALDDFRIFDVVTGQQISSFAYPERVGSIMTMQLSSDEKMVLAAHEWAGAYLMDVTTGKILGKFPGSPGYDTSGAALSPDNKLVAVCGRDLLLYKAGAGRLIRRNELKESPWAAHFSPDGTRLLVYFQSGKAQIWQVEPHALLHEWDEPLSYVMPRGMAWSPDGKYVLIGGEQPKTHAPLAMLWSVDTGELVRHFSFEE